MILDTGLSKISWIMTSVEIMCLHFAVINKSIKLFEDASFCAYCFLIQQYLISKELENLLLAVSFNHSVAIKLSQ